MERGARRAWAPGERRGDVPGVAQGGWRLPGRPCSGLEGGAAAGRRRFVVWTCGEASPHGARSWSGSRDELGRQARGAVMFQVSRSGVGRSQGGVGPGWKARPLPVGDASLSGHAMRARRTGRGHGAGREASLGVRRSAHRCSSCRARWLAAPRAALFGAGRRRRCRPAALRCLDIR